MMATAVSPTLRAFGEYVSGEIGSAAGRQVTLSVA